VTTTTSGFASGENKQQRLAGLAEVVSDRSPQVVWLPELVGAFGDGESAPGVCGVGLVGGAGELAVVGAVAEEGVDGGAGDGVGYEAAMTGAGLIVSADGYRWGSLDEERGLSKTGRGNLN
jgi:hypothetical protein